MTFDEFVVIWFRGKTLDDTNSDWIMTNSPLSIVQISREGGGIFQDSSECIYYRRYLEGEYLRYMQEEPSRLTNEKLDRILQILEKEKTNDR
jgi:hypothetical protein